MIIIVINVRTVILTVITERPDMITALITTTAAIPTTNNNGNGT